MLPFSYLLSPVGPMEANDRDDVRTIGTMMNRLGRLNRPSGGFGVHFNDGIEDAVTRFQRDNNLVPDGRILPRGKTEEAMRRVISTRPVTTPGINGSVGAVGENRQEDVMRTGNLLVGLGLMDPEMAKPAADGDRNGHWEFESALRKFQSGNGLQPDAVVLPDGPTAAVMQRMAAARETAVSRHHHPAHLETPDSSPAKLTQATPGPGSQSPNNTAPATASQATGTGAGAVIPVPRYRAQVPELRGKNWDDWSAKAGIIQKTLDGLKAVGRLPSIPAGTKTDALTADQAAAVYRAYFDSQFSKIGGHKILEKIGDPESAAALADTVFAHGGPAGSRMIQSAINKVKSGAIKVDGVAGSRTIAEFSALAQNPSQRRKLLDALADERLGAVQNRPDRAGWTPRINHFRFQASGGRLP